MPHSTTRILVCPAKKALMQYACTCTYITKMTGTANRTSLVCSACLLSALCHAAQVAVQEIQAFRQGSPQNALHYSTFTVVSQVVLSLVGWDTFVVVLSWVEITHNMISCWTCCFGPVAGHRYHNWRGSEYCDGIIRWKKQRDYRFCKENQHEWNTNRRYRYNRLLCIGAACTWLCYVCTVRMHIEPLHPVLNLN